MKKLLFLTAFIFIASAASAQIFYRPSSHLIVANPHPGGLSVGVNYEWQMIQSQVIYNLSNRFVCFATYNIDRSEYLFEAEIIGSDQITDRNSSGFSVGAGIHNIAQIKGFENLELLVGFEQQVDRNLDYAPDYPGRFDYNLDQTFRKFYSQINLVKVREKYDLGFSVKAAYLTIPEFQYHGVSTFEDASTFSVEPAVSYNRKFLEHKNLLLNSQVGFSRATFTVEQQDGGRSSTTQNIFTGLILKLGVQYVFY